MCDHSESLGCDVAGLTIGYGDVGNTIRVTNPATIELFNHIQSILMSMEEQNKKQMALNSLHSDLIDMTNTKITSLEVQLCKVMNQVSELTVKIDSIIDMNNNFDVDV